MPYKSDAQRRFFHSQGARKAGITPAMVEEWDEASRGHKVPDRVEKAAERVLFRLGKSAAQKAVLTSSLPNAPKFPKMDSPASLTPGASMKTFQDNASQNAQNASSEKMQAGESLTMPS